MARQFVAAVRSLRKRTNLTRSNVGILRGLNGIVIARPDPGDDQTYQAVVDVLAEEGLQNLPVLSGFDFGHTQPMTTLPYGIEAEINCEFATVTVREPATSSK